MSDRGANNQTELNQAQSTQPGKFSLRRGKQNVCQIQQEKNITLPQSPCVVTYSACTQIFTLHTHKPTPNRWGSLPSLAMRQLTPGELPAPWDWQSHRWAKKNNNRNGEKVQRDRAFFFNSAKRGVLAGDWREAHVSQTKQNKTKNTGWKTGNMYKG